MKLALDGSLIQRYETQTHIIIHIATKSLSPTPPHNSDLLSTANRRQCDCSQILIVGMLENIGDTLSQQFLRIRLAPRGTVHVDHEFRQHALRGGAHAPCVLGWKMRIKAQVLGLRINFGWGCGHGFI